MSRRAVDPAVHLAVDLAALQPAALTITLAQRQPRIISSLIAPRRAAVAAIFRHGSLGPEVLLMQRVQRASDRWSGQISFPGGMADAVDGDLLDTAIRETEEEVGLQLSRDSAIGRSDDQVGLASGITLPMAITPYVFYLDGPLPALKLGPEAARAFWLPLHALVTGELDSTYTWRRGVLHKEMPCWRYEDYVVWGLTHLMLRHLLNLARDA